MLLFLLWSLAHAIARFNFAKLARPIEVLGNICLLLENDLNCCWKTSRRGDFAKEFVENSTCHWSGLDQSSLIYDFKWLKVH